MAEGLVIGFMGVLARTLRKRSSFTLLLILFFSLSLLRTTKYTTGDNIRLETENEEEVEAEKDYITPKKVLHVLGILDKAVSTVEVKCERMVRFGGLLACSCEKNRCAMDGAKMLCLDPDALPPPGHCHALNFGIGYEFSFDQALVNYGCRVLAFDPTNSNITNRVYQANHTNSLPTPRPRRDKDSRAPLPPRRTFHALNLGLGRKDHTLILNLTEDGRYYRANIATFLTYRSLLQTLDTPRVDLIKLDIEGAEWNVLHEILHAPDAAEVLQHVRQILMEVHFDFLKPDMDLEELLKAAWRTIGILKRLKGFGFHLAAFDLNNTAQKFMAFGPMNVALFREVTLIRRRP